MNKVKLLCFLVVLFFTFSACAVTTKDRVKEVTNLGQVNIVQGKGDAGVTEGIKVKSDPIKAVLDVISLAALPVAIATGSVSAMSDGANAISSFGTAKAITDLPGGAAKSQPGQYFFKVQIQYDNLIELERVENGILTRSFVTNILQNGELVHVEDVKQWMALIKERVEKKQPAPRGFFWSFQPWNGQYDIETRFISNGWFGSDRCLNWSIFAQVINPFGYVTPDKKSYVLLGNKILVSMFYHGVSYSADSFCNDIKEAENFFNKVVIKKFVLENNPEAKAE